MTKQQMRPAHVVEIVTPKKFVLNGIWWGSRKPKQVVIFIHGLTGSVFSARAIVDALVDSKTAVVTFNNRGFEQVSEIKRKRGKKSEWKISGGGREIFTESADDIEGGVRFVRKSGVKNIYIAGHSTGCQKAIYWSSRSKNTRGVRGIVLFGPLSDYAIALEGNRKKLQQSVDYAERQVRAGKPHELMPAHLGPWFVCDAQRFLSLYTPDSAEEIFTYAQPGKIPRTLQKSRIPTLVMLAGKDEHTKRPANDLAQWFDQNIRAPHRTVVVPGVGHSFSSKGGSVSGSKGGEGIVARAIRDFMKELEQ